MKSRAQMPPAKKPKKNVAHALAAIAAEDASEPPSVLSEAFFAMVSRCSGEDGQAEYCDLVNYFFQAMWGQEPRGICVALLSHLIANAPTPQHAAEVWKRLQAQP